MVTSVPSANLGSAYSLFLSTCVDSVPATVSDWSGKVTIRSEVTSPDWKVTLGVGLLGSPDSILLIEGLMKFLLLTFCSVIVSSSVDCATPVP